MRRLIALAALALAAVAPATARAADAVATPFSGWSWGNPQPQGETLRDLGFAGSVGYAAGDFGTLLKTSNGGLAWQGLATGAGGALQRVRVLNASTVVTGGGCTLRRSDDGGATFAGISPLHGCRVGIASFAFADATTGWALLGNGSVLATDDGGVSWSGRAALPGTTGGARDIWALSGATVVAVAGRSIFRSIDGGATWTTVATPAQPLNGVYFATTTVGYATGDANTLLRTNDGGVTWTPASGAASLAPAADLAASRCAPGHPNLCLFTTRAGDRVLRTTDGGTTLEPVVPYAGRQLHAAAFASPTGAVAVGEGGATAISGNGGRNWAPVGGSLAPSLSRLRVAVTGTVFAPGAAGALARTTNGGADWTRVAVPTPQTLADASFSSASNGFALDSADAVYKTGDGGTHWTALAAAAPADTNAILSPAANVVIALGRFGVARSTGGQFAVDAGRPPLSDYDRAGSGLVLYGQHALLAGDAAAGGLHPLNRPGGPRARIRAVDFLSASRGFVLNRDGRLWTTSNGGRKWSEIATTGSSRASAMAWGDARNGYLAVDRLASSRRAGYVLRTSDGGRTWRPQLVGSAPFRGAGLVATSARVALALGDSDELFETASGGDRGARSTLVIGASVRRIARPTRLTVRGGLTPATVGTRIEVAVRPLYGGAWRTWVARTNAAGRFSVKVRASSSSVIVARWLGDPATSGDGSNAVIVRRGA
jgi:photosystem II stability/assembly factor-like uncharacterized protein